MHERTYISLFAGIGGLDLAVEALGYRCVGQVEWDKHCTAVLERWWPDVPRWGDIHEFTAAAYADGGEPASPGQTTERGSGGRDLLSSSGVGLIVGGFPCQPASTAGRRKGTEDDRWLWPEFARVISELGPRHVLVENVPGLLTVNGGRAFSEVIGTLADLGYDATWRSVRAADVGAPHRRERIFLLANATRDAEARAATPPRPERQRTGSADQPAPCAAPDPGRGSLTRPRAAGDGLSEPAERGAFAWGAYAAAIERWERVMGPAPHPVDDKGRLDPPFVGWMMGFPAGWTDQMTRTQALKALGNAVVSQQAIYALEVLW